ncbi:DUF4256 domain-containing protein [Mammaliicoccus sciuri]|uniref:DUF4256 domain-containing protein n=1 Tax=Mammaliicoccus sciuri TaxID=1296 RepID=UPI000D1EEEA0|nr:DUF4256 domain-containing protein [Mammaliicoccus sciuri]HCW34609.1 DUF4256 domain-containing protein [Staphylococcus sp.]MBO3078877.1 DUF4256 domain-containing protein [Mammaliicoccus sciuri]MCD8802945.1 DUF4256 domain-containing protein [Mammaliicoccus sciuri]MCD8897955.1 DUF4256 domain-containing protein [Mammaliicoccus sciuri]PTJ73982.1 DUF4256 domain-containing protein [Mammaliicoccus sciuri]
MTTQKLSQEEQAELLTTLQKRFEKFPERHKNIEWSDVEKRLNEHPEKLWSLNQMEQTEGEPDVIGLEDDAYIFVDCSKESPKGRRSVCYDRAALESRKKHKPETSVMDMVHEMNVTLINEEQYRHLQTLGEFDKKTSSWIETPRKIRDLGGALFCDLRYDTVFTYHNGADSYYGARGFRSMLKI